MKIKRFIVLTLSVVALTPWLSEATLACKIGENAGAYLPFNTTNISNADRLAIANIYIEAKRWPDVGIRAEVIAGAYKTEHNIERLKEVRGKNVRLYLRMLGVKDDNILIVKKRSPKGWRIGLPMVRFASSKSGSACPPCVMAVARGCATIRA